MFSLRLGVLGALAVAVGVGAGISTSSAATFTANLDTNFCTTPCTLNAGTVTVTEMADPDGGGPLSSFLHYSVSLNLISGVQTLFRTNDTSFLFELTPSSIAGLAISNIVGNGADTWAGQIPGAQQNPINNHNPPGAWSGGIVDTSPKNDTNGSTLSFDVTASIALTLANLARYPDKNNPPDLLWFAAEISQNGNTGYVGAQNGHFEETNPVPVPGAVWLMGSVLASGAGFGAWRRRRKNGSATA